MDIRKRKPKENSTEKHSDMILKKHVGLIHCENKLTLIQRKICNILLFNALDKINNQEIHEISLRKLCSLVGYNSNDTKLIKESIKSLILCVMEWNLLEDSTFLNEENYPEDSIIWNASSLLAGASIKSGVLRYSYSPQMKFVLSSLDIYGRINLFVQAKFNSTYSLVLYENCIRFKNIKQTSWFKIDLFRSLMGVSEGKYRSFKEFKRSVINPAIEEINQKADIFVEPHFKRTARKVTAVQFLISENENYRPSFKKLSRMRVPLSLVPQASTLTNILICDFHLSQRQVSEILAQYPNDTILEKINLVKSKENVNHKGAYFLAALKQDYKMSDDKSLKSSNTVVVNSYQREAKEASEIQPLKNKYLSYKLRAYTHFIQQQAENIQMTIKENFEQFLKTNVEVFRFYKKSGYSSPFVMADFIRFIDNQFPQVVGDYLNFDDFVTSDEI